METMHMGYVHNPNCKDYFFPIEWIILDQDDEKALVYAEKAISWTPFSIDGSPVTWEESYLRKWLNTEFYKDAFSDEERSRILKVKEDKLFIFNLTEFERYVPENNRPDKNFSWIGSYGETANMIMVVSPDGDILKKGFPNDCRVVGARPAMWIQKKKEQD